jgi:hypothetical protein
MCITLHQWLRSLPSDSCGQMSGVVPATLAITTSDRPCSIMEIAGADNYFKDLMLAGCANSESGIGVLYSTD